MSSRVFGGARGVLGGGGGACSAVVNQTSFVTINPKIARGYPESSRAILGLREALYGGDSNMGLCHG